MELFKLFGTIALDNAGANQGIDETTDKAHKVPGVLSKIGSAAVEVGKVMAKGLAVGAAAVSALAAKALSLGGELEQNMGGSVAVFDEYATQMQDIAQEAFSNMGLSTSDYLATANKMGALFQGAGFTIEESMNLSSAAMQRAADVASIMGIDTADAMEAIAGAAKGNFTMMDNLGVAMNDTALQAYALEKGIEKSTSEMSQQEKIALAMEMFLNKTAYAAGNYAKENKTLAGSLNTTKAALTNFLDGSGSVEDFTESFSNLAEVVVSSLTEILPHLTEGLTDIVNQLIPMIPPLLQELLPSIVDGAVGLINGLVAAIPSILTMLMSMIPSLLNAIQQIFGAIVNALPTLLETILSALPTLLPQLIVGIVNMIVLLCEKLPEIIQPIIDYLPDIIITVVDTLLDNLPVLIEGIITLVAGIVQKLPEILWAILECLGGVLGSIGSHLAEWLEPVWESVTQWFNNLWDSISEWFTGWITDLWEGLKGLVEDIKEAFSAAWDFIKGIWETVCGWFDEHIIQPISELFSGLWEGIKEAATGAINGLLGGIEWLVNGAISLVNGLISGINAISSAIGLGEIGLISKVSIPRLEKGGILEKGQVGLLEGTGAEAVVPLDRNQAWITAVAKDMKTAIGGDAGEQIAELRMAFNEFVRDLPDILVDALEAMRFDINRREFGRMVKAVN